MKKPIIVVVGIVCVCALAIGRTYTRSYTLPMIQSQTNLALGKATTQSSTYSGNQANWAASHAVDGDTNADFWSQKLSCTDYDMNAWLQIDLGSVQSLDHVTIYDESRHWLNDFHVLVSAVPFNGPSLAQAQATSGVSDYYQATSCGILCTLGTNRTGRYVRVQLGHQYYLGLAEVQVWGTGASPTPTPTPTPGSTPYGPMQIFFDASNNTGFGTTSPIFNDDGTTGANVGKYFAIDGVVPGGSAYLGLGGTITNPSDRVGVLNFYNRAQAGLDGRTATIASYNDGALGTGRLEFSTSRSDVGPDRRVIIGSQGNVSINRPNAGGATLSLGGLTGNGTDFTNRLVVLNSLDNVVASVTNTGRLSLNAPGEGIILKSPNGLVCAKLTITDSGTLTTAIVTCP